MDAEMIRQAQLDGREDCLSALVVYDLVTKDPVQ